MTRALEKTTTDVTEIQESFDFGPVRPAVRPPRPDERRSVLDVLGRAFHDDPVASHLFPNPRNRARKWARFSGLAVDAMADSAHVLTTDSVEGAAIWQRPTDARLAFGQSLRIALRFLGVAGVGARRATRLGEFTGAHRIREPHYYLAALGTDPPHQGKGIGSALIEPVLARADREGLPAYLESSKEANVPFYRKHGFEVVEELQVPGGPRVWSMLRPAR
ncbi:MAG: GNAT family N-acetyltransferase [bacterium]|nr:GNAT family N-acetyltransferase [bacterium]